MPLLSQEMKLGAGIVKVYYFNSNYMRIKLKGKICQGKSLKRTQSE